MMTGNDLQRWHQVVENRDHDLLHELLDENVEFHSPTLWQPKQGREVTQYILQMVLDIFQDFSYHRQWVEDDSCALEFSAKVEGKNIKGIDLIRWNNDGKIVHFEVMIRPLNGLQLVFAEMTQRLKDAGFIPQN